MRKFQTYHIGFTLVLLVFIGSCSAPLNQDAASESAVYENEAMDEAVITDSIFVTSENLKQKDMLGLSDSLLKKENLEAFEKRAIQKLYDLADFIQIISNPEYDKSFRKEAAKQAEENFIKEDVDLACLFNDTSFTTIKDLLKHSDQTVEGIFLTVNKPQIKEELSLSDENLYTGKISFTFESKTGTETALCDIILTKKHKLFGNKKESIWTIGLGNITCTKK